MYIRFWRRRLLNRAMIFLEFGKNKQKRLFYHESRRFCLSENLSEAKSQADILLVILIYFMYIRKSNINYLTICYIVLRFDVPRVKIAIN